MPIDYATPAGKVRLLIADTDDTELVLTDPMVESFLSMAGQNVKRAAAQALLAIAASESLKSKVIHTQDVQTDGAKLGAELRAQAKDLRAQADAEDVTTEDEAFFEIIPFGYQGNPEGAEYRP